MRYCVTRKVTQKSVKVTQITLHEPTCLEIGALANNLLGHTICLNGYDQFFWGTGISSITCKNHNDQNCKTLKNYIEMSSTNNNETLSANYYNNGMTYDSIPFQKYCDTFLDTTQKIDESNVFYQERICLKEHYRCMTGQCIPVSWICVGATQFYEHLSKKYPVFSDVDKLMNEYEEPATAAIAELVDLCQKQYQNNPRELSVIQKFSTTYKARQY
ncbi:unnamed protein product [Didymodactylos carnosus]|uniref:Uncharacterized protein n=1 Tax=Didymodactylos carnosus TaxID=1234261 RepID=A0A814L4H8_9BILA|nr:unnamed protein product [Didymodactylos carnosus]CAF1059342.1 unnamed protein product [Didymodactylos carnosus]CAF3734223.1 unnamed protein product [Didymodactylos carnosus]CAF3827870.1 unnamed protein product [Didymodactylos carnosus]